MDKYYSKKALILKAVYCFCLPLFHQLVTAHNVSLLWGFGSFVLIGCMYTVPMWISLIYMHRYPTYRIGRYVLFDLLFCFTPAVLGSIVYEIASQFAYASALNGFYTLLLFFIFLSVSGVFWLLYMLVGRHNRP
ncbi:MAG: hypothetical protein IJD82_01810 [Clostridia bacterium]|nr:hypothetical protein [Clostridia bacterium]